MGLVVFIMFSVPLVFPEFRLFLPEFRLFLPEFQLFCWVSVVFAEFRGFYYVFGSTCFS